MTIETSRLEVRETETSGFEFRPLGDRDELTRVRITDDEWDLNRTSARVR